MSDETQSSIKLVSNGKIAGWVFASTATILYMTSWVMAFISPVMENRMDRLGGSLNTAYLTIIGVWMATRTVKSVVSTVTANTQATRIVEQVRDPNQIAS